MEFCVYCEIKMNEVNKLKQVVTPLVKMMSNKGLNVRFAGEQPLTVYDPTSGKPTEVVLPVINEEAGKEVIQVYHGYLDHEVGHLLYTNLATDNLTKKMSKSKIAQTLFNIVEDARVEAAICKRYKGCEFNLGKTHSYLFDDDYFSDMDGKLKNAAQVFKGLIAICRSKVGQTYFSNHIKKHSLIQELNQFLDEKLGSDWMSLASSTDSFKIAEKIGNLFELKEEIKKESSVDENESSEDKNGEGGKRGKQKKKKGGKAGKAKEADKKDSSESKAETDDQSKTEPADKKELEVESFSESLSKIDPVDPKDCDDVYENHIKKKLKRILSDSNNNASYRVYTTDDDVIEHIAECKNNSVVEQMRSQTASMTGAIQKNLERAIAARSISQWTSGHRSGKISNPNLIRLRFKDSRVFKRKEIAMSKDVAVSLLLDCSGSMGGTPAELASTSAFALASVLQNMNIKCEVIGFTTKGSAYAGSSYSRSAPLYIPIFKSFNDRWDIHAKSRLAKLWTYGWMANNVDGESVQIAANRLMAQSEARKILIVLSDGYPNADGNDNDLDKHLKETVLSISKQIDVVGIGICSDAVERYYQKHVVLNSIEELPSTVIVKLRQLLLS